MIENNSINKRFTFTATLLVLFLLSASLLADSVQKPFLWKVEGVSATSYLFGTIHYPDERVTSLHPSVEHAFINSEYVYTEIPLDTHDMLAQVNELMLAGEQTLEDIVDAALLNRADQLVKSINPALSIDPFLKFKPWALATSLPLLEQQLKNPGALPLDAQIYQRAGNEGKGTGGIETVQEQLSYFERLTPKEELKMLRDTIDFMEQADVQNKSIAEEFIENYLLGDVDALGELLVKYVKEDEFSQKFLKKILHDRNVIMAERIYYKIKNNPSHSYFFAVGAGHYWGETGIQKLLQGKGLQVTPVN